MLLSTIAASLLLLSPQHKLSQSKGPDIVKSTHWVLGKVVGFEVGDFEHVIIETKGKHKDSYFVGTLLLDDYMAFYANRIGRFKVRSVDTYIEQAGGRQLVDQVSDAIVGRVSFNLWSKSLEVHHTKEQIDAKFRPLVDKLTKKS
ncbi:MAG TPA: hypothetical protein VGL56_01760 [Fimbriimonadaceae bacterium]|jgi:hypothetical protein